MLHPSNDGESIRGRADGARPGRPDRRGDFAYVVVHEGARGTVAWVRGDLDVSTAPLLLRHLVETLNLPIETLVVDLAQVRDIDRHGLAALRVARKRATTRGITLSFEYFPDAAMRVAL